MQTTGEGATPRVCIPAPIKFKVCVMPFLLYLAVALVALFGVAMQSDLLVEPTRHIERAVITESQPVSEPAPATTGIQALPPYATPGGITPPEAFTKALTPRPEAPAAAANCHVDACTAAYHSFTASDCTYQPTEGPRRLCTK